MKRSLLILLVILVALGGAFVAQRMGEHPGESAAHALVSMSPEKVQRFEVTREGQTTVIARTDDGWRITAPIDAPADGDMVDGAVTMLATLISDGVISSNPDKAPLFEVDPEHGIGVAFYGEGADTPLVRYTVGKLAPGFTHTYVTLEGSHDVHRVKGPIRFQLQKDVSSWRDRSVLRFDPVAVSRLAFFGDETLDLTRADDGWRVAGDDAVAPDGAVQPILKYLSTLRALSFEDAPEELTGAPLLTISIWTGGQPNPTDLVVEAEDPLGYRVVTDADPQRYLVGTDRLKELVADPKAALALKGEAAEPAADG